MKKQILVVEDERLIATDIQHRLHGMGYEVAAFAPSGEEAVKKAVELRPDLILMDIVLGPGINGIEAARLIHASHNTPIVYVSANINEDTMEEIKATNPFGFIVKPFEDRELRVTIEMALYRHQMEEALRVSEEKYRTILENIEEAYFEVDLAGNFTFFNNALCMIMGLPRNKLMGTSSLQYVEPETANKIYKAFNKAYRTGKPANLIDYEIVRLDGTRKTFELSASLMKDPSGEPMGFRGVARNVTERKLAEETLRKSEERYRTLFENNPIETIIVDNRAVITGYNHEKVKSGNRLPRPGDVMYRDYAGKHKNDMYAELMECIESGVSKEFPDAHYGDQFLYIKISPFPEGAIITSIDVTESKRLEERLSHLATHDPLTGLPNRALYNDRLSLELVRAQRSGKKLAVMLLDLDNFKEINDSWGHTVGDEVLKIIGRRLPEFLRKSDSIARMGGMNF
ncbi:MAG: PAS domain S-box protein [Syntrophales bacterium]|nr:PAS domain S-box protein [Syntrophales bacterium]